MSSFFYVVCFGEKKKERKKKLSQKQFKRRHFRSEHAFIEKSVSEIHVKPKWYEHQSAVVIENDSCKILWDVTVQANHFLTARRLDMIVIDKEYHECQVIEEDWEILGPSQGTKESVECESDSGSVRSWITITYLEN